MMGVQKGFTLLELLIGMVLLGMILTLLFGGLRLGARSWDSGDKRADDSAQLRAIHCFMRRELSQVFPLRWKNEADTRLAFAGASDALKFVAPLPVQVSGGGLYLLGLELENGEEGQRLIMKRALTNPEAKDFSSLEQGEKSVLADHIEKMSISYFGAATPEQDMTLLYFERDCPQAAIAGMKADARYTARWFDPRNGKWINVEASLVADASGRIALPPFPNQTARSDMDWALKLTLAQFERR